jgi:hypothetical protein
MKPKDYIFQSKELGKLQKNEPLYPANVMVKMSRQEVLRVIRDLVLQLGRTKDKGYEYKISVSGSLANPGSNRDADQDSRKIKSITLEGE